MFFNWTIIAFYRILCFSVIHQQESATGTPMSPASWTSHLPPCKIISCSCSALWKMLFLALSNNFKIKWKLNYLNFNVDGLQNSLSLVMAFIIVTVLTNLKNRLAKGKKRILLFDIFVKSAELRYFVFLLWFLCLQHSEICFLTVFTLHSICVCIYNIWCCLHPRVLNFLFFLFCFQVCRLIEK